MCVCCAKNYFARDAVDSVVQGYQIHGPGAGTGPQGLLPSPQATDVREGRQEANWAGGQVHLARYWWLNFSRNRNEIARRWG